ncbi:MAG: response regulator [Thermoproteota archaeon]|jgi:DNA-binding response OmpR family regulator|nr:response regulator [Thermoproteota archaeon]
MQSSNDRRILIVDDEPDVTGTFKLGLEENGFNVETFNDPEIALSNFKPGKYDLMLLDIKMPKMNGFELYEKMRRIDSNTKTKVCFITAYEVYYQSLREQFPETKIECYIKKPIQITDLSKRLYAELSRQ